MALHPRNVSHVKFKWKQAWEAWLCFWNLLRDQPTEESLPASAFGCIGHSALNLLPAHGERRRIGGFKGGFQESSGQCIIQIHFPLAKTQSTGPSQVLQGWETTAGKGTGLRNIFSSATGMTNTFMEGKMHNASKCVFKIPSLVHNKANGYVSYYNRSLITYHIAQYTSI